MDVRLKLMALPGVRFRDIRYVGSYPVAYAQCGRFLTQYLPGVMTLPASSTGAAACDLATSGNPDTAVIAPQRSADIYG